MFRRRTRIGQATIEFVTLFVVIVAALAVFQKYILRGISGRWKGVGDAIGQERLYDPQKTAECRFATFFRNSSGQWFDQKGFESSCKTKCLGPTKSEGACNSCLSSISGGCGTQSPPSTGGGRGDKGDGEEGRPRGIF